MAVVATHAVMSLDGFIARPDDSVGPLFDWYENGDTALVGGQGRWTFHVSKASADYHQRWWDSCRAVVMGRRLFDTTNGWNGVPSVGERVFVVTHEPPTDWVPSETLSAEEAPFTFVTTGVEDAVARARVRRRRWCRGLRGRRRGPGRRGRPRRRGRDRPRAGPPRHGQEVLR